MNFTRITKAISDPTRFNILQKISEAEEIYCTRLTESFTISQPAISHHLKVLGEADLITGKKAGQHLYLSVNRETVNAYIEHLKKSLST